MSTAKLFNDYQSFTRDTAVYPAPQAHEYLSLALCNEVGEVAAAFHPFIPFTYEAVTHKVGPAVLAELGDVMWYVARMTDEMGCSLSNVSEVEYEGEASIPAAMFNMVIAAAEIAGRRKKMIRDGASWTFDQGLACHTKIIFEIGKVVASARVLARFFDSSLEGVMHANKVKLLDRKERGTIHGDGDKR